MSDHFWKSAILLMGALALLASACSDPEGKEEADVEDDIIDEEDVLEFPEGTAMRFQPAANGFFALPFPDDARWNRDEGEVFGRWPGSKNVLLLQRWLDTADELLEGWGLSSGIFAYFTDPLDPASLPVDAENSVDFEDGAPSVFLVDVDPESVEVGQVLPITCQFRGQKGTYHNANQLGCISPLGVVRRPMTRYALVITSGLLDEEGQPVVPDEAMVRLMAGQDLEINGKTLAAKPYLEALEIIEGLGVEAQDVRSLILFTTHDPTARLRKVNAWYQELPEPEIDADEGLKLYDVYDDYAVLTGYYEVPVIQTGERPYKQPPSGKIIFDESGEITMVETQKIRFYLTIPRQEMPEAGYPVLFYLHGSGGEADELMDRGPRPDVDTPAPAGTGPGGAVAPYGVAGFAADFNLHGMRHSPPDKTGLMLYNLIENPRAAVDNFIIGANEVILHARLMAGLEFDPDQVDGLSELLPQVPEKIRFNDQGFSAMGQSMGSTIGLPALTLDSPLRAGIFSGSGGVLIEIALKSMKPINVGAALKLALRYDDDEELDTYDPILSALQHIWDFVDPVAHGRHVFQEPHGGVSPKHSLQHSGLDDGYFSTESRAAFSTSLGAPLAEPVLEEAALEQMKWRGLEEPISLPVQQNLAGVTAVVRQYEPSVLDGHNVAFQLEEAQAEYACFALSLSGQSGPILRDAADATVENCQPD